MASSQLNLKHPQFQVIKQVPVGFSWTVFFFGFFSSDFPWGLEMGVNNIRACYLYFWSRESYFYVYLQ